ncbi:hypothetical protein BKA80DRAFT_4016 [Phyllosticta citrichinensis]
MCAMPCNSQADYARCRTIERVRPGGGNTVERGAGQLHFAAGIPAQQSRCPGGLPRPQHHPNAPEKRTALDPSLPTTVAPSSPWPRSQSPLSPCGPRSLFLLCAHSRTAAVLVRPASTPRPRLSGAHHTRSVGRCTRFKALASSFINIHCTANTFYA